MQPQNRPPGTQSGEHFHQQLTPRAPRGADSPTPPGFTCTRDRQIPVCVPCTRVQLGEAPTGLITAAAAGAGIGAEKVLEQLAWVPSLSLPALRHPRVLPFGNIAVGWSRACPSSAKGNGVLGLPQSSAFCPGGPNRPPSLGEEKRRAGGSSFPAVCARKETVLVCTLSLREDWGPSTFRGDPSPTHVSTDVSAGTVWCSDGGGWHITLALHLCADSDSLHSDDNPERCCHDPHFTDGEAEALRGSVTCPGNK